MNIILIDFLDVVRSGMPIATEKRVNLMAKELGDATFLTLNYQPYHTDIINNMYQLTRLHSNVNVLNFYNYYYSGIQFVNMDSSSSEYELEEEGYTYYKDERRNANGYRYYDEEGSYAKYKAFDVDFNLLFIDYQSNNMQRTHRVEYNGGKRKKREIRYNLMTNKPIFEKYYDHNENCFLSVWINSQGQRTKSILHADSKLSQPFKKCIFIE